MVAAQLIPLSTAVICCGCSTISDSRTDICPACGESGSLLNLARILNPTPELGSISYIVSTPSTVSTVAL